MLMWVPHAHTHTHAHMHTRIHKCTHARQHTCSLPQGSTSTRASVVQFSAIPDKEAFQKVITVKTAVPLCRNRPANQPT